MGSEDQIKKKYSFKNVVIVFILLILPILLFILPKTQFDHGPTMCVFTIITGKNCLGCGMTRACMRLIHFDIYGALDFNIFSVIVFPSLCYYYLRYLITKIKSFYLF